MFCNDPQLCNKDGMGPSFSSADIAATRTDRILLSVQKETLGEVFTKYLKFKGVHTLNT